MYVCILVLYNCFWLWLVMVIRKPCFFHICGGPNCPFAHSARRKVNIHGKCVVLWNGMGQCMYVWMGPFPRPARAKPPSIHTYISSCNSFFKLFWCFRLKTWPWLWKRRFRVFEKTLIFHVGCMIFHGRHGQTYMEIQISGGAKTEVVSWNVCMYVCMFAQFLRRNIHT